MPLLCKPCPRKEVSPHPLHTGGASFVIITISGHLVYTGCLSLGGGGISGPPHDLNVTLHGLFTHFTMRAHLCIELYECALQFGHGLGLLRVHNLLAQPLRFGSVLGIAPMVNDTPRFKSTQGHGGYIINSLPNACCCLLGQ